MTFSGTMGRAAWGMMSNRRTTLAAAIEKECNGDFLRPVGDFGGAAVGGVGTTPPRRRSTVGGDNGYQLRDDPGGACWADGIERISVAT